VAEFIQLYDAVLYTVEFHVRVLYGIYSIAVHCVPTTVSINVDYLFVGNILNVFYTGQFRFCSVVF